MKVFVAYSLVLVLTGGCAMHTYRADWTVTDGRGNVSIYGKPSAGDSSLQANVKSRWDDLQKELTRKARIEATNDSLLVAASLTGGRPALQRGIVINASGHNVSYRCGESRPVRLCPDQNHEEWAYPGQILFVVNHLDQRGRVTRSDSGLFPIDWNSRQYQFAGKMYDWFHLIR